jgi:hypothetical protein
MIMWYLLSSCLKNYVELNNAELWDTNSWLTHICWMHHHSSIKQNVTSSSSPDNIRKKNIIFCSLFSSCCVSWLWYLAVNVTIKINRPNCSEWFYLIVAISFGPRLGPSSGSFTKYVSCYWAVLIWIHISAYNTCNRYEVARIFLILKFFFFSKC